MRTQPDSGNTENLATRALAVALCVPLFELSLYLGLALALGSGRVAAYTWLSLPWAFHLVYLGVVLAIAATGGMSGITSLLGHLFLTHHESRRNMLVTLGAWAFLVAGTAIALAAT
ncbi:hypothetical protein [Piscinibacter sp.]|uniref:hypothetical protein n=1 Tax=Piscinibacter sp. TaxID=1903157 RepID=UPI0039E23A55